MIVNILQYGLDDLQLQMMDHILIRYYYCLKTTSTEPN